VQESLNEKDSTNATAEILENDKSYILNDWIANVRAEISVAKNKSNEDILDHLGYFFNTLVSALRMARASSVIKENTDISREHGYQRAQFCDYTLDQIIHEYHLLRKCIFDYLVMDSKYTLTEKDRKIIHGFIDNGIQAASVEFVKLQSDAKEFSSLQNSLLDATSEYMWLVNKKYKYLYANLALTNLWGVSAADVAGKTINELVLNFEKVSKLKEEIDTVFTGNRISNESWTEINKVTYCFQYELSPVFNSENKIFAVAGISRNITSQKNFEMQLVEEQKKLQISIKDRDTFLSIASHELKTPLTSLSLQSQMRKRQLSKGNLEAFTVPKLTEMFESDVKQLQGLNRLIEDMLDISRIRTGKLELNKEKFDLGVLVTEVVERFKPQIIETCGNLNFMSEERIFVEADSYRIEQVIANLLTNAMKYGECKPLEVKVFADKENSKAFLCVTDKGIGINQKDQQRIFARFERAVSRDQVSGLGLGLAIVKDIIEAHGGEIQLDSEVGVGSTFTIALNLITEN
jgi:PAS domain S-box-containing protein